MFILLKRKTARYSWLFIQNCATTWMSDFLILGNVVQVNFLGWGNER